ncbi:hypothetical protein N4T77_16480 [Clostridium sp. CX1]|uniref:Uncharacterized protein n=1 Tax=Clostridium tanneri TaxID=3037988 RepID=A0ABU4JSX5_9CLOT|nr:MULTISPECIES: hypothetical protein [unclassified Clostridium]MCT8978190.1 hypothetical protein [Clostridium sp. CX1]MDW8801196.1 hypothetical protein [Clostridium sp. A1-XYC3]
MGKHRSKSFVDNLNLGELLKSIDINQIISLVSTLVGANNMNVNQLSSMLRNYDLNDIANENGGNKFDENKLKSQLSALADKLDEVDGGKNGNIQDELLKAVKNLQLSSDDNDAIYDFLKSNLDSARNNSDEKDHKRDKKSKK